jgi:hypothetical protein
VIATTNPDVFTQSLLHFDGITGSTGILDEVGKTWTASGTAKLDGSTFEFSPSSLRLDGSTSCSISTPVSSSLNVDARDFTIECWFNFTGTASGVIYTLFGQDNNAGTDRSFFGRRGISNHMNFNVTTDGSTQISVASTTTFTDVINPGWHHYAGVRSGNNLLLFIDGVLEGSGTVTGSVWPSTSPLAVGALGVQSANTWQGWIDEFRFSNGIARWTTSFQPPTAPYTLQTNLFSQYPVERIVSIPGNLQP